MTAATSARSVEDVLRSMGGGRPSRPPLVWTRKASKDNLVVLSDDALVVASVPRAKLAAVKLMLEGETRIDAVLPGPVLKIPLLAVKCVSVRLDRTDAEVNYDTGGRRIITRRIPLPDAAAQADFLCEARERLPVETHVEEATGSRVFHALKPANLLALCAMLLALAHVYYTTDALDKALGRDQLEEWSPEMPDNHRTRLAMRRMLVRQIAYNPRATGAVGVGMIFMAAVAGVLNALGHVVTVGLLATATVASLMWTISRYSNPPRSVSVVADSP